VRHERQVGIAMLSDMVELLQDGGAVIMHGVGDFAEMRDDGVVTVAKVATRQYCGRVYRHGFDHDHRCTTARTFLVVASMALTRKAVIRHIRGMGSEHDAVVEFAMP
jgi:hypothetical protein